MPFSPYLDKDTLRHESAWYFTNWQPVLDATTFDDYLDDVCTRAGRHIAWRVGADDYATSDETEQAILLEMELVLAQYYLCLAVAAIADSSEDPAQNPVAGAGVRLRDDAEAYKGRCEELIAWWTATVKRGPGHKKPRAKASLVAVDEIIPHFDETPDFEEAN